MQEENFRATAETDATQTKEEAGSAVAEADCTGGETGKADGAEKAAYDYGMLLRALSEEEVRERLIFGNEELCNEIIGRYLDELTYPRGVPLVRGFSAISPLPVPKSLDEAKAIVDKGKIK